MKKFKLLLSIALLIIPTVVYPQTYTKSVLLEHFSVELPEKIIQEHGFTTLKNILRKKAKPHYSSLGLHYGIFQIKNKEPLLWIYNNSDIHHGNV